MNRDSTGGMFLPSHAYNNQGMKIPRTLGKIIFSPDSSLEYIVSKVVPVAPGIGIIVSAYNIPDNEKIYVNRIVRGSYRSDNKGVNCSIENGYSEDDATTMFTTRMALGDPDDWILTSQKEQLLIAIPGNYTFELSNINMLGGYMHVEYIEWGLALTPQLPDKYFAGITK